MLDRGSILDLVQNSPPLKWTFSLTRLMGGGNGLLQPEATGGSFTGIIVIVTVATAVAPMESVTR